MGEVQALKTWNVTGLLQKEELKEEIEENTKSHSMPSRERDL